MYYEAHVCHSSCVIVLASMLKISENFTDKLSVVRRLICAYAILPQDEDFKSLPYFVSTRETTFETTLLQQLDAEVLIGQLSYKQRSEIYDMKYGYDNPKKKKKVALDTAADKAQLPVRLVKSAL